MSDERPTHDWPADQKQHVWGPWRTRNRTTQYRVCVGPQCRAVDEREAL